MGSELEGQRKVFEDARTLAEALERAAQACKDEARGVVAALEVAALEGDAEQCSELMEDLRAIEARHVELCQDRKAALDREAYARRRIIDRYIAAADGGPPVDWVPVVVFAEKANFTSWGGAKNNDGKVMLVDRPLSDADLEAIQHVLWTCEGWNNTHFEVKIKERDEGLRLSVMYPTYRGGCWADIVGDRLLGMLRPIFAKNTLGLDVAEFCAGLDVLKE